MKLLFIGDVFGKPGRQILENKLGTLRQEHAADVVVVNVENAAGGFGVTPEIADDFLALGVDMMTTGNHVWNKKEIQDYIKKSDHLIRPHNMPHSSPGSGIGFVRKGLKKPLAVVNLIGRVFMGNYDCPFRTGERIVNEIRGETNLILVDFHAEATSEKRALGWFLDGKVSALVGTHTHVQTADESILTLGTGYISDVGMTGPHDSVIGVDKEPIITRFITQMPMRFAPATDGAAINGVSIELNDDSGRCESITRICVRE